ncbi:UNVERIFIED_CONTAM: hypothetical protein PYX00_006240 [Menopon gallinae]|uniref:Peptidase S1 domain-containing protein n=1 Tax=Menopon gallinae TaxID=328185 RepID=A0AAW2HW13_9NEOP
MFRAVILLLAAACVFADIPRVPYRGPAPDLGNGERIILGENANEGDFPFIGSLRRTGYNPGHTCGLSILTSNWVLTASHCCAPVKNLADFYVYVGSIYLDKGGSSHPIEKMVMHENYQQSNHFKNDICLLRVSKPFQFSDRVKQVVLAPENYPVPGRDKVNTAGWGLTDPNGKVPNRLQKGVNFVTLTQEDCGRQTKGFPMFPGYVCVKGSFPGQTGLAGRFRRPARQGRRPDRSHLLRLLPVRQQPPGRLLPHHQLHLLDQAKARIGSLSDQI